MFSAIGFIIVFIIKAMINAEEDVSSNNGWRPIQREKVFENPYRNFINTSNAAHSTFSWNPIVLAEENNVHFEPNTKMKPHDINRELMSKKYDIGIYEIPNDMDVIDLQQKNKAMISESHDPKPMHKHAVLHQRKAKKMLDNQEHTNNIYLRNENSIVQNTMQQDKEEKNITIMNDKAHKYEVTEGTEASEVKALIDVKQSKVEQRKSYFKPTFETVTKKNLSNILFSILGNYNIRVNDDLTNYAISRSKQNTNSNTQGYVYSAPTRIPPMRNSQNHFPLDPLLAVLLSNYGYYLPGFYGFPGNYYNIYGNLASNNIHNNKPFGAYKIYSDTDSSH